jgi:hypothetical protein
MAKQLDMFDTPAVAPNHTPRARARTEKRVAKLIGKPLVHPPTIDQQFLAFVTANPHVMPEMLRLARAKVAAGATRVGAKALWEELRVSIRTRKLGDWKLNNNFTSRAATVLIEMDPSLKDVIETRRRKS